MKPASFFASAGPQKVIRRRKLSQLLQTSLQTQTKQKQQQQQTVTHALAAFTPPMCIPARESPGCCSAAAPFCAKTNGAQHGNVMENCVCCLPSMQRPRISLEAAPRLLPSVFSMNEPGCCGGQPRRRGRGATRDASRKQTLVSRHIQRAVQNYAKTDYVKRRQNAPL